MGTAQLKEEIQRYIDRADRKLLHMMQAVAKAYYEEDYALPGDPMTAEEYKANILEAKADIERGNYTTQEDLENEVNEW